MQISTGEETWTRENLQQERSSKLESNKLQPIVVFFIKEAENRAVSSGVREERWLRTLLEKNLQDPTIMCSHNPISMKIVKIPVLHARTKHLEL